MEKESKFNSNEGIEILKEKYEFTEKEKEENEKKMINIIDILKEI